jgi:tRNA/rRNA methyltransferase
MKPVIVLVAPQMGENIGACARAMLNCGIEELRIVNPRDGWPNERAQSMSAGAFDKMPPVKVFNTTAEALTDCHYTYATTARPRDMVKPVFNAKQAAADVHERSANDQRCAYLFGCERTGLENDDIALAHAIITIPVNPDFSSLNLGQGVLLCAYEWFQASLDFDPRIVRKIEDENRPASHDELNNLYTRLEGDLAAMGFFRNPDMQPTVMRNIKNMLGRGEMTFQEVNTFHGMIAALMGKKLKS